MYNIERVNKISSRLINLNIASVEPVSGGGNNRLFCLRVDGGSKLAFKFYPRENIEIRPRLLQEYSALRFMTNNGFTNIPLPISYDLDENCAIYTWIDGEPVVGEVSYDDLTQMTEFLNKLQRCRQANTIELIKNASASVFSMSEVITQLNKRYDQLLFSVSPNSNVDCYLRGCFLDAKITIVSRAQSLFSHAGICPDIEIIDKYRVLSPSDFGKHNILRGKNGQLMFLDFEYFGWDDPAKLISDTLLHPGSQFSESEKRLLKQILIDEFLCIDPNLMIRYEALYPIFGIIWCLIILNCFLPNGRHRQVFSNSTLDYELLCERQLKKSIKLMNEMREYVEQ